eukprot:CFRG1661T1
MDGDLAFVSSSGVNDEPYEVPSTKLVKYQVGDCKFETVSTEVNNLIVNISQSPQLLPNTRLERMIGRSEETSSNYRFVVELNNSRVWQRFRNEETEMILSVKGRQMTPRLKVQILGLDPKQQYAVWLHFSTKDKNTSWRWNSDLRRWKRYKSEPVEIPEGNNFETYTHPWISASGAKWMENEVVFDNLRLSIDPSDPNNVCLHPFKRYIPVLYITPVTDSNGPSIAETTFFPIEMAQFISTTAYRNPRIACLKIERNPIHVKQRLGLQFKSHSNLPSMLEELKKHYRNTSTSNHVISHANNGKPQMTNKSVTR